MAGQARDLTSITNRGAVRTYTLDSSANKLDVLTLPSWCNWIAFRTRTNAGLITDTGAADSTISATQQAQFSADVWHSYPTGGGLFRIASATGSTVYDVQLHEERP